MRPIIFRAKRVDNGEWVEGSLIELDKNSDYVFICPPYLGASIFPPTQLIRMRSELVIPETVGQYTGLKDKNGKKIFEGDIVRCDILPFLKRVIVEFFDGAFVIKTTDNHIKAPLYHYCHRTEVIGNVFDTPELLEEEND